MAPKIQHKRSAVKGKAPQPADLEYGELAVNYESTDPGLFIKDSADNVVKIAGAGAAGDVMQRNGTVVSPTNAGDTIATDDNAVQLVPGSTGSPLVRDSSGHLGIGSPTPSANLYVKQSGIDITAASQTVAVFQRSETFGHGAKIAIIAGNNATCDVEFGDTDAEDAGVLRYNHSSDSFRFNQSLEIGAIASATPGVSLDPGTTGSPLVRDSNGRIGIGVSSPSQKLHVASGASTYIQVQNTGDSVNAYYGVATASAWVGSSTDHPLSFFTHNVERARISNTGVFNLGDGTTNAVSLDPGSTGSPLVRDSSGNLGIGNAAPAHQLDLNRTGSTLWEVGFDANQTGANLDLDITSSGTSGGRTGQIRFLTGTGPAQEAARFDSAGRLLVGATSVAAGNQAKLVVNNRIGGGGPGLVDLQRGDTPAATGTGLGHINFSGADTNIGAMIIGLSDAAWTAGTSQPTRLEFHTTPNGSATPVERMRISQDGNVFCLATYNTATTSSPKALYIGSSGVLAGNSSVRRSKGDIDYAYNHDWLRDLKPCSFKYRKEGDTPGTYSDELFSDIQYGLIAEEVEPINPELCNYNSDGELIGIEYPKLVTPLLSALQEAMERIEDLEAKVTALEGGSPTKSSDPGSKTRR